MRHLLLIGILVWDALALVFFTIPGMIRIGTVDGAIRTWIGFVCVTAGLIAVLALEVIR